MYYLRVPGGSYRAYLGFHQGEDRKVSYFVRRSGQRGEGEKLILIAQQEACYNCKSICLSAMGVGGVGTEEMTQAFETQRQEQLRHLLSPSRGSFLN